MPIPESVLWLDHKTAKLFSLDGTTAWTLSATPEGEEEHRPNKATASGRRGDHSAEHYYRTLLERLPAAGPLLICGPSTAKLELSRYLEKHAPALHRRVVAVEPMDHPTEHQLVAWAKRKFAALEPV